MLKTGIPWEMLPQEMGCGSGITCWRRLRDWQAAGVWYRSTKLYWNGFPKPTKSTGRGRLWDRAAWLLPGGESTGRNPTDRGKSGSKRHLVVDRRGVPLAIRHTGANVHDVTMLETMVDAIPPLRGRRGRPRKRPAKLHADKAYDSRKARQAWRRRRITPRIARRKIDSSQRLGRYRWVVERTLGWLNRFRRLKVRYERRADIHQAFLTLGCALIRRNFVQRFC